MSEREKWTDHEVERILSRLLLVGVSMATIVVVAGGILFLVRHGHETPQFEAFHGEPAELRTLGGLGAAVRNLEARAVIQLGLGLLIATPVARVVFSLFAFIRQRDGIYVVITGIVLTVLLLGLFSAQASSPVPLPRRHSSFSPGIQGPHEAVPMSAGFPRRTPHSHPPASRAR